MKVSFPDFLELRDDHARIGHHPEKLLEDKKQPTELRQTIDFTNFF